MANDWGTRYVTLPTIVRLSQGERCRLSGDVHGAQLGARRVGSFITAKHIHSRIELRCRIIERRSGLLVEACGTLMYTQYSQ